MLMFSDNSHIAVGNGGGGCFILSARTIQPLIDKAFQLGRKRIGEVKQLTVNGLVATSQNIICNRRDIY